jgi:hypothetical protein
MSSLAIENRNLKGLEAFGKRFQPFFVIYQMLYTRSANLFKGLLTGRRIDN